MAVNRLGVKQAVWLQRICSKHTPSVFVPVRQKYDKKGIKLPGKLPIGWRNVDHNPANIPSGWIPDKWKEENIIDYEREKELAEYIPGYEPKLQDHEHADYHSEALYSVLPETKLVEGLQHALNLVKCVLIEELPQNIQELSKNLSVPDQDDRVIQALRQAFLFDIDPKFLDKKNEKIINRQDNYFIYPGVERYCPAIMENMMRICQSQSHLYPKLLKRLKARDVDTCAVFRRTSFWLTPHTDPQLEGKHRERINGIHVREGSADHLETSWKVSISGSVGTQLLSADPLEPFADKEEVKKTEFMSIPDIFPVFPIVDLKKKYIYNVKNSTGFKTGFSYGHLHTLVINNTDNFTAEELYGKMASHLFAGLFSRAVNMYGDEPIDLPTPFMGQCIASDGQNFQFLCMQLNTTQFENDNGIKNMAWIEQREKDVEEKEDYLQLESRPSYSALPMFSECSHRTWRSLEYYADYDPKVFQTFLALWMNGAT